MRRGSWRENWRGCREGSRGFFARTVFGLPPGRVRISKSLALFGRRILFSIVFRWVDASSDWRLGAKLLFLTGWVESKNLPRAVNGVGLLLDFKELAGVRLPAVSRNEGNCFTRPL
jgi:uncharacterized membrane protein YhdT